MPRPRVMYSARRCRIGITGCAVLASQSYSPREITRWTVRGKLWLSRLRAVEPNAPELTRDVGVLFKELADAHMPPRQKRGPKPKQNKEP